MSRMVRLTLAAAALAALAPAVPATAHPEPPCRLTWGDELVRTSPGFPVQFSIGRPSWVC